MQHSSKALIKEKKNKIKKKKGKIVVFSSFFSDRCLCKLLYSYRTHTAIAMPISLSVGSDHFYECRFVIKLNFCSLKNSALWTWYTKIYRSIYYKIDNISSAIISNHNQSMHNMRKNRHIYKLKITTNEDDADLQKDEISLKQDRHL